VVVDEVGVDAVVAFVIAKMEISSLSAVSDMGDGCVTRYLHDCQSKIDPHNIWAARTEIMYIHCYE
jgi:hypothetical protein